MRKVLFIFVLMSLALSAHAQQLHRVYCELLGTGKFMSSKVNVTVDFGQEAKGWSSRLVDENGNPLSFNSMVDAMNYMGRLGWKFEQAYVVTSSNQNVYHWLLSKDIPEGEAINEGFNIRKDAKEIKENKKETKNKKSFIRSEKTEDDVYN